MDREHAKELSFSLEILGIHDKGDVLSHKREREKDLFLPPISTTLKIELLKKKKYCSLLLFLFLREFHSR